MGSFLNTFGKLFFVDALEWLQGKHGFRAPEVPRQVRAWKKTLSHIKEDYADHFHDLISSHEYGLGKEQTKKWVDNFTNELIKHIDIKMGPWNQLPLCLGELLTTKFQSAVAQRIVREAPDDDDEACKYVPPAVWKAIKSLARAQRGNKLEDYTVPTQDGGTVTLRLYLSLIFWCICVHNVDSESAFSIIGHKLGIAANTRIEGLANHLMAKKNPQVVSAAVFEARYKDTQADTISSYATYNTAADPAGVMAAQANPNLNP